MATIERYSREDVAWNLRVCEQFWGDTWPLMDELCAVELDVAADMTTDHPKECTRLRELRKSREIGNMDASDMERHDAILKIAEWAGPMYEEIIHECRSMDEIRAVVAKYRAQYGPEADTPLA